MARTRNAAPRVMFTRLIVAIVSEMFDAKTLPCGPFFLPAFLVRLAFGIGMLMLVCPIGLVVYLVRLTFRPPRCTMYTQR